MGKSKRTDRSFTREQRLSKENRQLKKELAHLRKQIARLDLDRFETLRQMVADHEESKRFEESAVEANSNIEALKRDWACHECDNGFLEIVLYSKMGTTQYYRKCNNCTNRTKGKRYEETVKGILKND